MLMQDKNGITIKTGDIVKIEGGYFNCDNGTFLVKHSCGDPTWLGSDYSLKKCNKQGVESNAKNSVAFWPLMITVNSSEKRAAAKQHNKANATIEIIGEVKVYDVITKQYQWGNVYEYHKIVTEKEYRELLAEKNTEVEIIEEKQEVPVPVIVEQIKEVAEVIETIAEEKTTTVASNPRIIINEELARRNKENYSFSDYVAGSETAEFNAVIASAAAKIEIAKTKVSDEGKARLKKLLVSYTNNYANWVNKSNANGASHVSVMIAGPSNYNMNKHNKWMEKESKLWAEYDDIKDIDSKIYAIVNGDKIIKSDDANAIEKLQEKLAKALEEHQGYKDYNIKARKEGTEQLRPYVLQNSNGRIKAIKDRIAHLERLAAKAAATPIEKQTTEINGIKIIDNLEVQRLQIIFNGKPSAEVRNELKKNGFRWCPTNSAWQRYRSNEAERIASQIVSNL